MSTLLEDTFKLNFTTDKCNKTPVIVLKNDGVWSARGILFTCVYFLFFSLLSSVTSLFD